MHIEMPTVWTKLHSLRVENDSLPDIGVCKDMDRGDIGELTGKVCLKSNIVT